MFEQIEKYYHDNHYKLIEDRSEGSIRPGKSFTKDVENCITKFKDYFMANNTTSFSDDQLPLIIGDVDTNTRSQNLRVMREFKFLYYNEDTCLYEFSEMFINFVESGVSAREYVLNVLYGVKSLNDFTMYINLLICTLREAYLYGQVMLFKDSIQKFKSDVPDLQKRNEYRKRIFEVYGYTGRDNDITSDVYSPNLSYMSRTELENLGFLDLSSHKIDNMNYLLLTKKGFMYLEYLDKQLGEIYNDDEDNVNKPISYETGYKTSYKRNRIVFGAPGTGKSFQLNEDRIKFIGANNESDYERVTFHPDYSYANFVGTYKPVPSEDDKGNSIITYEYVPGPFMRILVKALKNSRSDIIRPFVLLIEEINRANVASVFGEVFQLLDRSDKNSSEYPVETTEDMKKYLMKELGCTKDEVNKIKIPDNMFIWATMNSADQGVFQMDTAFKRRWDFTYIGIDDSDKLIKGKYVYLGENKQQKVEWNSLRKAINQFLANNKINEDKQLGPYFISRSIVAPENTDEIDRDKFISTFKNKVIMYLFEDAGKRIQSRLFEGCTKNSTRYSEICKEFDRIGINIFNNEIVIMSGIDIQQDEDIND